MKLERAAWVVLSLMSGSGSALPSIEKLTTDGWTSHGLNSLTAGRVLKLAGADGVEGNPTFWLFSDKRFSKRNALRGGGHDGWWTFLRRNFKVT